MHGHLTRELFRAIHQGWRNPGDLAAIAMAHLFELCPACRGEFEIWRRELEGEAPSAEAGDFDAAIERIRSSQADTDGDTIPKDDRRQEDRSRTQELLDLPPEDRAEWIRSETAKRSGLLLAEALIDESCRRTPGYPHDGYSLANLARLVLHHAPASPEATELYARALAYLANAVRVIGDLPRADQLLGDARYLLGSQGGGDRLVRAELDSLEASLRIAQERDDEAVPLLLRALMICRVGKVPSAAAAVLIKLGLAHRNLGDPQRSLKLLGEAERDLEGAGSPRLLLVCRHNSVLSLCREGELDRARELLVQTRALAAEFGDPLHLLRRSLAEADLSWRLQELDVAEARLLEVRDGFSQRGLRGDKAVVSLDLARLYTQQGRSYEVLELAEAVIPVFRKLGLHGSLTEAQALKDQVGRR